MSIPILVTSKIYSPELVRANPNKLFVFGDNLERVGNGGQACIRGEANSIGIATKVSPSECFSEYSWMKYKEMIDKDLRDIERILSSASFITGYKYVVFPEMFVGTGLASLPVLAPTLMFYLSNWYMISCNLFGVERDSGEVIDPGSALTIH